MNIESLTEEQKEALVGGEVVSVVMKPNLSAGAYQYISDNISPIMVGTNPSYEDYHYEAENILDFILQDKENAEKSFSSRDMIVLNIIKEKYAYLEVFSDEKDDEGNDVVYNESTPQKTVCSYTMPPTLEGEVFYDIKQHERQYFLSKALSINGVASAAYPTQLLLMTLELEAMLLGVEFDVTKITPLRIHDDSSFILYNKNDKLTTIQYGDLAGSEIDDKTLGYVLTANAFRTLALSEHEHHKPHNETFTDKYKNLRRVYVGILSDIISGDNYEVSNDERKTLLSMDNLVHVFAPLRKD